MEPLVPQFHYSRTRRARIHGCAVAIGQRPELHRGGQEIDPPVPLPARLREQSRIGRGGLARPRPGVEDAPGSDSDMFFVYIINHRVIAC